MVTCVITRHPFRSLHSCIHKGALHTAQTLSATACSVVLSHPLSIIGCHVCLPFDCHMHCQQCLHGTDWKRYLSSVRKKIRLDFASRSASHHSRATAINGVRCSQSRVHSAVCRPAGICNLLSVSHRPSTAFHLCL